MKNTKWIAIPLLFRAAFLFSSSVMVTGCVTVNVNIPEGDVQQASDDYVRELYEAKSKPKPAPSPSVAPRSKPSVMNFLIPSAQADERHSHVISTKGGKLDELMTKMRGRLDQIAPLKKAGVLGETKDGRLMIKSKLPKGSTLNQAQVKKLVSETNHDRAELYHEILSHNRLSQTNIGTVERSFAHSFQKHSPPGTWIQDDDGSWSQKK